MSAPGRVAALWVSPRRGFPMRPRAEVRALAEHGLEGCAHARPNRPRQVLLLDAETLKEFGVAPGALKENITTEGVALPTLPPETRLRVGEALLEITKECKPCEFVNSVQADLLDRIGNRRGQLARVIEAGSIRVGDSIYLIGS